MGKHCLYPDVPLNHCACRLMKLSTHAKKEKFLSDVSVCEKIGTAMAVAAVPLVPALLYRNSGMWSLKTIFLIHHFPFVLHIGK